MTEEGERDGGNTTGEGAVDSCATGGISTTARETLNQAEGAGMDVEPSEEKSEEVHSKVSLESHSFLLDSLSSQLHLDELWRALSDCLDMLAQTSDPHAVLILQPTVEAFFLVHASNSEENKPAKKSRTAGSRSRSSGQPSMLRVGSESGDPGSSAAFQMEFSPLPSTPGLAKGEESYSHLPADTAKFLMFAG